MKHNKMITPCTITARYSTGVKVDGKISISSEQDKEIKLFFQKDAETLPHFEGKTQVEMIVEAIKRKVEMAEDTLILVTSFQIIPKFR